jgi:transcriptional regulator of NAD metabolism
MDLEQKIEIINTSFAMYTFIQYTIMSPGPEYIESVGNLEYPDLFVSYELIEDTIKIIKKHLELQEVIKRNRTVKDQVIHVFAVFECVRLHIHFLKDSVKFMNILCERLECLKEHLKQFNEPLFTFYESFFQQFME